MFSISIRRIVNIIFIGLIAPACQILGQTSDTTKTLHAEQVLDIVRKYHPVVRQTDIHIEKSRADLLIARGGFDPAISTYIAKKTFDGTNYYNQTSPELSIPTWFGVEIHTGLENLAGNRLDPTMTKGQSSYVGVTVPLAKNLLMDKRRAFLKQVRIFNTMALAEQRTVVNDLLMDAMEAYWLWVRAYKTYKIVEENVVVNERRLELIKKSFINGERPAIDTVETLTQLQSFRIRQNENYLEFQNAGLQLSVYLWQANDEPYLLPETIIPQNSWETEVNIQDFNTDLNNLLSFAAASHPELQLYDFKLEALQIDKKLKFQSLLPKADFTYNHLNKGYNALGNDFAGVFFNNNYRYGFKFEVPLRLSEGRGEYRKVRLKIEETNLGLSQKQLSIQVKIRSYYNEFNTLKNQLSIQNKNFLSYQQLVKAEEIRFLNGESSLFLINSRENKALEAQEKLVELKTKFFKTIYALQWSAGLLVR